MNFYRCNELNETKKLFLPSIIFSIEQEVCTDYGHTNGHNGKD